MTKGKFDEFADLSHLLTSPANIVITDIGQVVLLVLASDGFAFGEDFSIRTDDTERTGFTLDDLELHSPHPTTGQEEISLLDGAVSIEKVGFDVDIKEVTSDTLDTVIDGKDMDPLAIRSFALMDRDNVTKANLQVVPDH